MPAVRTTSLSLATGRLTAVMAVKKSGTSTKSATVAIPVVTWNQAKPAPVILISGSEDFLADRATVLVRNGLRASHAELEIHDLDASTYTGGELLVAASPSLFAEPRLIRVSAVEKCSDEFLEDALTYCAAPEDEVTLILRHAGGVRGKRLLELIRSGQASAIEISCAELKSDADKSEFAAHEFRLAGRKASPGAVRALVSAFASNAAELASACQQLIADADGDITEATVDVYYGGRVEATAFKVADAAIEGRIGDAMLLLRQALDTGADPVPIVAAFASKLRLIAKIAGDRRSSNELAGVLGAAPWQIDRAKRELHNWSESGLSNAILAVADADAGVKGASRDPIYALERMVRIVATFGRDE